MALCVVWSGFAPRNCQAAETDVVINEIMFHPPSGQDQLQYIELLNRGGSEVNLSKWALTKGVKYTFPEGTKMGPGAYLVVCRDRNAFATNYGPGIRVLGNFTGKLSHKSERVELSNAQGQRIDSVKYAQGGDWPLGAGGYSSSLERICPSAESDLGANWAASNWPLVKKAAGTPGRQNDNYSSNLPPVVQSVEFSPKAPMPGQKVKVTAKVSDAAGMKAVMLLYRVASSGRESEERAVAMTRLSGDNTAGIYEAAMDGQAQEQLVRFRISALSSNGAQRVYPSPNEPRPSYSYFSFTNAAPGTIPQIYAINIGRVERGPGHYDPTGRRFNPNPGLRGCGALLYVPMDGSEPETFDYVHIITRFDGYKVHFQKDRPLKEMTGINVIVENSTRWLLAEPLSYVVYRLAGVPAPLTEHVRLTMDGRLRGFHLVIEQPNETFLRRNGRNASGNLYKLVWYGQGIIGQHEKKTNPSSSYDDLVGLIEELRRTSGAKQWAFIEQQFNVDECVNYYAVNMCIQNWDGFFNNYFAYHDTAATGKWEIYPWDEDKTWGDYDGASSRYDWYAMPLTFGMNGDRPARDYLHFGGGPFGGVSWWRPPGYFSGPLLANPEFRRKFLARLQELCQTVYTEQTFYPIIDAMEKRLEPEVRLRAQLSGQNPQQAARQFANDMQSFRNQVQNRRKFILKQLGTL